MRHLRAQLKQDLGNSRLAFSKLGYRPECALCGKPILYDNYDMHEAIITRGNVRMAHDNTKLLIFDRRNCVLVHHGKCHREAAASGREKVIRRLIEWEGLYNILDWLNDLIDAGYSKQFVAHFAYEVKSIGGNA